MPILQDRQSVAANLSIANVLSGKSLEFLQGPSFIEFAVNASAIGLFYTILIGTEVIVEDQEANSQNRYGVYPDDFIVQGAGIAGNRLVIKLRNSTAGAITAFSTAKITPL